MPRGLAVEGLTEVGFGNTGTAREKQEVSQRFESKKARENMVPAEARRMLCFEDERQALQTWRHRNQLGEGRHTGSVQRSGIDCT